MQLIQATTLKLMMMQHFTVYLAFLYMSGFNSEKKHCMESYVDDSVSVKGKNMVMNWKSSSS